MNNVIIGYLTAYGYLILAFIISLIVGKFSKNEIELPRKVVHIMAGMGWIIYKLFFEGTFHPIIISSSFVIIAILSKYCDFLKIQKKNNDYGLIYFTGSMTAMSFISFVFPDAFDAFGIAIICLSVGDGMAAIIGKKFGRTKWNKNLPKTIEGTFGGIFFSFCIITAISVYFQFNLSITGILIITIIAGTVEIISDKFDNIAISAAVFSVSCIMLNDGLTAKFYICMTAGIILALLCLFTKFLNPKAILYLCYGAGLICYWGGSAVAMVLLSSFILLIIIHALFGRKTA